MCTYSLLVSFGAIQELRHPSSQSGIWVHVSQWQPPPPTLNHTQPAIADHLVDSHGGHILWPYPTPFEDSPETPSGPTRLGPSSPYFPGMISGSQVAFWAAWRPQLYSEKPLILAYILHFPPLLYEIYLAADSSHSPAVTMSVMWRRKLAFGPPQLHLNTSTAGKRPCAFSTKDLPPPLHLETAERQKQGFDHNILPLSTH